MMHLQQEITASFTANAVLLPDGSVKIGITKGLSPFRLEYFDKSVEFDFPEYLITDIKKGVNLSDLQFYLTDSKGEKISISLGNPELNRFEMGALNTYFRRHETFFKFRGGVKVFYFKKRSSSNSQPCPVCSGNSRIEDQFIPLINATDKHCEACFDTGYRDGYFPPLETMFNYSQNSNLRDFSFEPIRYDLFTFFTYYFPSVEKDDLFYSPELNRFFRVVTIQNNQYKGIPLIQFFQAQTVDQNSILWNLLTKFF